MTSRAAASTASARDPGPTASQAACLGLLEHLVVGAEVGRGLADGVGAGRVGAVAARHRAADVDHDRVAGLDHPVRQLVVRAGAVGPGADDHEVDGGVALGDDRLGDVPADLALGAAGLEEARAPARGRGRSRRRPRAAPRPRPALLRIRSSRSTVPAGDLLGAGHRGTQAQRHHAPTCGRRRRPRASAGGQPPGDQRERVVGLVPGHISTPSAPAGDACAAGSSRRGTTRNGSPSAGSTRQVSRPSGRRRSR